MISSHESKLLLANGENELLAPLVDVLLPGLGGRVAGLADLEVVGETLDDRLAVEPEVEVAEDKEGLRLVGLVVSSVGVVRGQVVDTVERVLQRPLSVVDVDRRHGLDALEVAGIVEEVDVDKVNRGLVGKLPSGPQISYGQ